MSVSATGYCQAPGATACSIDRMALGSSIPFSDRKDFALHQRLRSQRDVVRHVAKITAICIAASVALTLSLYVLIVGTDPKILLSGSDVLMILLGISISVPAIIPPVMSYRMTRLLRDLTIAQERLKDLAQTDQLTALLNRRGFDERAGDMLAAARVDVTPIGAMMADIDRFKTINDLHGHDCGDAALRHVAAILRELAPRDRALLGRQGGDEFAVMTSGLSQGEAVALAENIRAEVARRPLVLNDRTLMLTMSFGLALETHDGRSLGAYMSAADAALLAAKRQGRNRVSVSAGS